MIVERVTLDRGHHHPIYVFHANERKNDGGLTPLTH